MKDILAPILDDRFVVVFPVRNVRVPLVVPRAGSSFPAGELERGSLEEMEDDILGEHHDRDEQDLDHDEGDGGMGSGDWMDDD